MFNTYNIKYKICKTQLTKVTTLLKLVKLQSSNMLKPPEDDADALKHVGVNLICV